MTRFTTWAFKLFYAVWDAAVWPRVLASLRARREIQLCKLAKEYFGEGIHPSSQSVPLSLTDRTDVPAAFRKRHSRLEKHPSNLSPNFLTKSQTRNIFYLELVPSSIWSNSVLQGGRFWVAILLFHKFVLVGLNFVQSDSESLSLQCPFCCQKRSIFSPSPRATTWRHLMD